MSRSDTAGDVSASNTPGERQAMRRPGANPAADAPSNPAAANTDGARDTASVQGPPMEARSQVIRRIARSDDAAAAAQSPPPGSQRLGADDLDAPPGSRPPAPGSPAASHPAIRRLLPARPAEGDEARRQAVIRAIEPEHPRAVSAYLQGGEADVRRDGDVQCGQCGARNRSQAMFCSSCGSALPAVRGLPNSLKRETEMLRQADREREMLLGSRKGVRPIVWRAAGLTHPGKVRDNNEDFILAEPIPGNGWLLIVADGMGGAEAGEVASSVSATLVRELVETRIALDSSPDLDRRAWLAEAIEQANLLLHRHAEEDPALNGMGTTIVVALVQGQTVELAHVGDSRCYLLSPAGRLEQLTVDHSIVAHLVRMGLMDEAEANNHPLSSQLYRAVAASAAIEVDTAVHELPPGGKLLLCSDGLPLHVTDEEIAASLRQATYPEDACSHLLALALARGGEDNISVITLTQG